MDNFQYFPYALYKKCDIELLTQFESLQVAPDHPDLVVVLEDPDLDPVHSFHSGHSLSVEE